MLENLGDVDLTIAFFISIADRIFAYSDASSVVEDTIRLNYPIF